MYCTTPSGADCCVGARAVITVGSTGSEMMLLKQAEQTKCGAWCMRRYLRLCVAAV